MKKTLHSVATLLCLLTLFVSAATCMNIVQPKQSSCGHCPPKSPFGQEPPSCCSVQQQQPSTVASTESQLPIQLQAASLPIIFRRPVITLSPSIAQVTVPPPPPPRTQLRI